MAECGYFQTYESGQADQAPGCRYDLTKAVLWGGEMVCKTIDPAGSSLCTKMDVAGTQVSPMVVAVSVAGWWLLWRILDTGKR